MARRLTTETHRGVAHQLNRAAREKDLLEWRQGNGGLFLYPVADPLSLRVKVVKEGVFLNSPLLAEVAQVGIERTPTLPPPSLFGRESRPLDAVTLQLRARVRPPSAADDGEHAELIRSQLDLGCPKNG
jgi:hypothetical protein